MMYRIVLFYEQNWLVNYIKALRNPLTYYGDIEDFVLVCTTIYTQLSLRALTSLCAVVHVFHT